MTQRYAWICECCEATEIGSEYLPSAWRSITISTSNDSFRVEVCSSDCAQVMIAKNWDMVR